MVDESRPKTGKTDEIASGEFLAFFSHINHRSFFITPCGF